MTIKNKIKYKKYDHKIINKNYNYKKVSEIK